MTRSAEEPNARERIRESALRLFAREGYAGAAVREIVEEAGVTKPVLYYYYKNKEDLFRSILTERLETYFAELEALAEEGLPLREQLKRYAFFHFHALTIEPDVAVLIFRAIFRLTAHTPAVPFTPYMTREHETMRRVFTEAAARGEFPPDADKDFAVTQFAGLVHVYFMRQAFGFKDVLDEALAGRVADFFLAALSDPDAWNRPPAAAHHPPDRRRKTP